MRFGTPSLGLEVGTIAPPMTLSASAAARSRWSWKGMTCASGPSSRNDAAYAPMLIVDDATLVVSETTLGGRDDAGATDSGAGDGGWILYCGGGDNGACGDGDRGEFERERGEGVLGVLGIVAGGAGHDAVKIEIGRGALTLTDGVRALDRGGGDDSRVCSSSAAS